MKPTEQKIDSLESIRGIAAVVVVIGHAIQAYWPQVVIDHAPPFFHIWHRGDFAVRVFFVLSGFVLSHSYWRKRSIHVIQAAAIRRYFRLAVPVLFSVLVAYVLQAVGFYRHHQVAEHFAPSNQWLHSFYMHPVSLGQAVYEGTVGAFLDFTYTTTLNVVLWTMEVELKGSFFVYSLLVLAGNLRYRMPVYLVLAFILDTLHLRYMLDFLSGVCLCDWHVSKPARDNQTVLPILLIVLALGLGDLNVPWLELHGLGALQRGSRFWPTAAATMLVGAVVRSRRISAVLSSRPLVILGAFSFAIYLFHIPILCSVSAMSYLHAIQAGFSNSVAAVIASAVLLLLSLSAGVLGPYLLDPAGHRLGKWFEEKLRVGITEVDARLPIGSERVVAEGNEA